MLTFFLQVDENNNKCIDYLQFNNFLYHYANLKKVKV